MAPVTLAEIREIVEQANQHSPLAYLLLCIAVAGPAFTAYLGAYFRKRADTAAIQADLGRIKDQLRQTTTVAEQVKAAVGFQDWHERESLALRRQKLEELAELAAVSHRQMRDWWVHAAAGALSAKEPPHTAMDRMNVLTSLYFSTLEKPMQAFLMQLMTLASEGQKIYGRRLGSASEEELADITKEANAKMGTEFPQLSRLYYSLLDQIIEVMKAMIASPSHS